MAGFLRKKVKQDSQAKRIQPQPNAAVSAPSVPPLFARFSSTSQAPQETQRIVSSPMLLSSSVRKDGAPASHHSSSRATVNVVRRDTRDIGARNQRTPTHTAGKGKEMPNSLPPGSSPHDHYHATQSHTRPVSRAPMFDKPLPSPTAPPEFNSYNTMPYQSGPTGIRPVQAPTSFPAGPNNYSVASPTRDHRQLSHTTISESLNQIPQQRKQLNHPAGGQTPQHNRSFNISPSTDAGHLTHHVPQSPDGGESFSLQEKWNDQSNFPVRVQKAQPPIASTYIPDIPSDPDHNLRLQTLTPRPSNPPLPGQDLQAARTTTRSDTGASPSRRTSTLEETATQQLHQQDAFQSGPLGVSSEPRGNQRRSFHHSPVVGENALPDFSEFVYQQEYHPEISGPPSSPTATRKSSKGTLKEQPRTPARQSIVNVDNNPTVSNESLPTKFDNGQKLSSSNNMGVNASNLDVSAFQPSYKDVRPQTRPVQHPRVASPPDNLSPQQRISHIPTSSRISSMKSVKPPTQGKPLIFAAMAAIDQEVPGTTGWPAETIDRIKPWSNLQPQEQQHVPPTPSSLPTRKESLATQRSDQNGSRASPSTLQSENVQTISGNQRQPPVPTQPQIQLQPQPPPLLPPKDAHTPYMGGRGQLPPNGEHAPRHSPSKTRKLSKTRTPGHSSSDFSVHSHASNVSSVHRSPGKVRPTTPSPPTVVNVNSPIQVESDVVGIPLDEDPFAKAEGVKMLKPGSPTKDGTIKGRSSQFMRDGASEEFHSASEGESQRGSQASEANSNFEQNGRQSLEEPQMVSPPVASVVDGRDRLTGYLSDPHLLSNLLAFLSFYDWCMVLSLSRDIRFMLVQTPDLRETVLERFLKTVGYSRWIWDGLEPLSLSLQDLCDYMRGVSTPTHEYSRVADLYVHSLSIHPTHRDPSLYDTVHQLAASTRAYTRVVLRLRAQAEKEVSVARAKGIGRSSRPASRAPSPTMSSFSHSNHSYTSPAAQPPPPPILAPSTTFQSPLFRLRRAPLLRVFVPSPDGDWLSDKSVLECEGECKRAGVAHLMRAGDVVWDVAVGDEGNVGRLVWDGSYLLDLDYTYSSIGDLPKYMPTLAFPPSYFHRVIRTGPSSSNPIVHIDLRPWGEEVAMNLQLLQDRVRTETPQGAYHNVVRWVHRSSFVIRSPARGAVRTYSQYNGRPAPSSSRIPIPDSNGLFVDPGWYGTIVVETEGTNESLADLQDRCGPGAFPPRPLGVNGKGSLIDQESKKVFRIMREKSRPGEIWIKAVSVKERLL